MRSIWIVVAFAFTMSVHGAALSRHSADPSSDYLPDAAGRKAVSITDSGPAFAGIVVLTEGVAIQETGPKETVKSFGEMYQFAPSFFAVRRDEATKIEFWNLQPDDEHDVMLFDPDWNTLMKQALPPLKKRSWVFTFHREGLYRFYCTVHLPEMAGQILVLPPRKR